MRTSRLLPLLLAVLGLAATGCAVTPASARSLPSDDPTGPTSPAAELRLGYFPNITHSTAVYGVASGLFAEELGTTRLSPQSFNAGPAAVEALFAGAVDAAYLGPNPAVNAFVKSRGEAVRIVAGAASGGAQLVVREGIDTVEDLRGARLATPQTGGTQDIALRAWLAEQGFEVDERGAGDVDVLAQDNAQTLTTFRSGEVDGAWVPEPWASRLVLEAGAHVLVDEADLWPGGRFVTTHLVVRTEFLRDHPQTVEALVRGSVAAGERLVSDPAAKPLVARALGELTGKPLPADVLDRAWAEVVPTADPLATTLLRTAEHAFATGLVDRADLTGLYDLTLLRRVLGRDVDDAGLGQDDLRAALSGTAPAPAPATGKG